MQVSELFLLSLTSKNARKIVSTRKFKSTGTCFDFSNNSGISKLFFEEWSQEIEVVRWAFRKPPVSEEIVSAEILNITGIDSPCRITINPDSGIPIIWCDSDLKKVFPSFIHRYFCDLFNVPTDVQISMDLNHLHKLPNTDFVKNVRITGLETNAHLVNSFFDTVSVSYCAILDSWIHGDVSLDSSLFKVENICLYGSEYFTIEHLLRFEGKHAFLSQSHLTVQDIIRFIHHWIDGRGFKNLETLMIFTSAEDNFSDRIPEEIELKPWDLVKRPYGFYVRSAMRDFLGFSPFMQDCSKAQDVERKEDGLLATVLLGDNTFIFNVWRDTDPKAVVRNEILLEMQVSELFLLSLTSKKARKIVSTRKFKSTGTCFDFSDNSGISELSFEEWREDIEVVRWAFRKPPVSEEIVSTEILNVDGIDSSCRITINPYSGIPTIWCSSRLKKVFPSFIHRYFCDLFNVPTDVQISMNLNHLHSLPDVKFVKNVKLAGFETNAKLVDSFLNTVTVSNCAMLNTEIRGDLSLDSSLLKIDNICLYNSKCFTVEHLLRFEGRHVFLSRSHLTVQEIVRFIQHWIDGKGLQSLETLVLFSQVEDNFSERIPEEIELKPWDPAKRPSGFYMRSAMRDFLGLSPLMYDCSKAEDVERKEDGLLATVLLGDNTFIFNVWRDTDPKAPFQGGNEWIRGRIR
ncbi:hypothetical protein B9Z55_010898 [Caenorhabditis nigoni]|nr:hypothetical protein B9Z55_010898 [Caenorhabditis nigoni]